MKFRIMAVLTVSALAGTFAACDDSDDPVDAGTTCEDIRKDFPNRQDCVFVEGGDAAALLNVINDDYGEFTTILLGEGTYELNNSVTLLNRGTHIVGQGMEKTILDFLPMKEAEIQSDGIYAQTGYDFLVQDLTVIDAVKDGIKVEDTNGVVYRRVKTTWRNAGDENNGPYGIYPVRVQNVLVEDSVAENASDAGLYVGQCQNAIVRNNVVRGNVAGLEIENTQYADVYGNLAEDNTAGIVVFDLRNNPIFGRDVRVFDNVIRNNNRANFAPGGIVKEIPAGTGTFAMASRRVEIFDNLYENNNILDIALLSGLTGDVGSTPESWAIDGEALLGTWSDLTWPVIEEEVDGETITKYANYQTSEVYVHGNTHSTNDTVYDNQVLFGNLLRGRFNSTGNVTRVIYETSEETAFNPEDASEVTNDMNICVSVDEGADMSALLLLPPSGVQLNSPVRYASDDMGVFGCDGFMDGPITPLKVEDILARGE